ncbi:MAG TPA: OmpA family protein [Cyclobacteriaceae bacterium]|jgi:outer membrane protein OmpA-like peptidoglycan-associated protein|nr:OmpA family protein [Cyclobacteriaceae bacterium]
MKLGLIFCLACVQLSFAQNLVPNPGFEEYFKCPGSYNPPGSDKNIAPGWISPTLGTPDLFNRCSFGNAGVPHNWAGVAHAHKGYGYSGIYAWVNNNNYREYLQAKLIDSLERGKKYQVEFFFRLSVYSKYSVDRIGALLSDSLKHLSHDRVWTIEPSYTYVMDSTLSKNSGQWNRVSFEYDASGGEQFITIGNFSSDDQLNKYHLDFSQTNEPLLNKAAYYYIDDVLVTPIGNTVVESKDLASKAEVKPNEVYILKHIYFDFNSYELMPLSNEELSLLLGIMKKNPKWKVELSGHTDDKGDNVYNYNLSMNRAKSVGRYLVQNGIVTTRIKTIGFGKRKPLRKDRTEEARAINRRVEVKFLDK